MACQMVVPYPPGIPLILPGLRITQQAVEMIRQALHSGEVHGLCGAPGAAGVRVLAEREVRNILAGYNQEVRERLAAIEEKFATA